MRAKAVTKKTFGCISASYPDFSPRVPPPFFFSSGFIPARADAGASEGADDTVAQHSLNTQESQ